MSKKKKEMELKALMVGSYVVYNKATLRKTAKALNVSKSTAHNCIRRYLKEVDFNLYLKAMKVLKDNKEDRAFRGGIATKASYEKRRRENEQSILRQDNQQIGL